MNLRKHFAQPPAVRVLLLAVFILSALFFLIEAGLWLGASRAVVDRGHLRDELVRQSGIVGSRLIELEAPALALLARGGEYPEGGDAALLRRTLRECLDKAPQSVLGVGLGRPGEGEQPHLTVYLSRDDSGPSRNAPFVLIPSNPGCATDPATARETNINRRFSWRVEAAPTGLTLLLSARCAPGDSENRWASFVATDFAWMGRVLADLEAAGARGAYCVTPEQGYVWRHRDGLHFSRDFPVKNVSHDLHPIEHAHDIRSVDGKAGGLFKTEVIGTGWQLAVNDGQAPFTRPLPALWIALASLAALVLEGLAARSFLGGRGTDGKLRNVLFKYRLTTPEQAYLDSQLQVARQIQFNLVPSALPRFSEWREFDLHAYLAPVREVGGDFFDYCRLDADRLAIVVGDVSGNGVPASLYMAVCQTALRTLMREAKTPGDLLTRVNNMLVRDNTTDRYVTVAVFFIDMPTGRCQYALAGHPAPLWLHAASGVSDALDSPRGTFVGLKGGIKFPTGEMSLRPGDTLLLYTDGVTEARNARQEEMETRGLAVLLEKASVALSCRELVESLEGAVASHIGPGERADDLTLMAFRYWGPGGKKMAVRKSRTTVILQQPGV